MGIEYGIIIHWLTRMWTVIFVSSESEFFPTSSSKHMLYLIKGCKITLQNQAL